MVVDTLILIKSDDLMLLKRFFIIATVLKYLNKCKPPKYKENQRAKSY